MNTTITGAAALMLLTCACAAPKSDEALEANGQDSGLGLSGQDDTADSGSLPDDSGDPADTADTGSGGGDPVPCEVGRPGDEPDPFADILVAYAAGEGSGFGQEYLPDVVLGAPCGSGDAGSLDVVSLGREGVILLEFDDIVLVDGEGPDLLVFENAFTGWPETGRVSVSEDGETWHEWPCDATDAAGGYPGCAGVGLVWSHPDNDIDPTNPDEAGGDAFDLADLGLSRARFVRITDSGANSYDGNTGGFDLDAIAVVHGEPL